MPPSAPAELIVQRQRAMPQNSSPRKRSNTRTKAAAGLLAALILTMAAALFGATASAQRGRNDNASQRGGSSSRRVIVGRGSDTANGSRTTITADDSLNDYSAYRSGDRFYVVLPKSAAGAVSKGSGKGYTDVQVQQRGDSVIVSYKVQPGAKPRVEQKFNRLDVVFDVKEGGQPAASGQQAATQQQQAGDNRNANAQQQQQQQQQAAQPKPSATTENPNERRPAEVAPNAGQPGAVNQQGTTAQPVETATQPNAEQTQAAPSPTGEQAAPTSEPQVAQNVPPAPIAPITRTDTNVAGASGVSFGAMLVNNWPIALFVALLVIGVGLVFFTRRSSAREPAELEAAEVATATTATTTAKPTTKLEEPRAALLKETTTTTDAEPIAAKTATLAEVAPLVTTPAVAAGKKKKKKDRKGKARGGRVQELPLSKDESVEESSVVKSVEETSVAVTSAELAEAPVEELPSEAVAAHSEETPTEVIAPPVEETAAVEEIAAAETETPTIEAPEVETEVAPVEASTVETTPVETSTDETEAAAVETPALISTQPSEDSTLAVEDSTQVAEDTTHVAEEVSDSDASRDVSIVPAVATVAAIVASTAEPVAESKAAPVVESAPEPVAETAVEPVVEPAADTVTSIAPAGAPDAEDVQTHTRRLLEGESYDRSVIGSRDSMARQLIGAELLSALAGRNAERRERAREAFVEHGYFEEKTRDVREAAAPAERSAAARSLAIVGERNAAPHLIAALEDDSMEVRRAAVEALGALREPTAIGPLEALLLREKVQRNRIPSRIIQHAIETCRLAAAEEARAADERARAEAEAASVVSTIEPEAAAPEAVEVEESAPQVEEAAPRVEEVAPQVEESARPSLETSAVETQPAVEAERALEIEPVVESQPAEESQPVEEPLAIEEPRPVEEPSHVGESPALDATAFESSAEVAESETPVAESHAVEPFFSEPKVTEETESVAEVEASAPAEASSVEPSEETSDKSLAPLVSAVEPSKVGEWVEFDMSDIGANEPAQAAPTESVFELSSGEAMQPEPFVAEPEARTHDAETYDREPSFLEIPNVSSPAETSVEARDAEETIEVPRVEPAREDVTESSVVPSDVSYTEAVTAPLPGLDEKGVVPFDEHSIVPAAIQHRLASRDASVRAAAITELSHVDTDEAFQHICAAFDDEAKEVRSAAARALYELRSDRAESFTRALREANADRRRNIGAAVSTSGLAGEAISQLTGESRDKTYEASSLLFLMAKAGEVQPLVRAIEGHPNNEVRLAVVKLLALSGQKEILPAFRRLAVRGSLPTEVRSAVMEAIYQISSGQPTPA